MPQVLIKLIDGTNIVTEQYTKAQMQTKVQEGQGDSTKSVVDIDDVGGHTLAVNMHRVCYIKEIPNT